jgi:RND family efflux transporter MFP subunit
MHRSSGRRCLLLGRLAAAAVAVGVAAGCSLLPTEKVSIGDVNIQLPQPPPPPTVKVQQGDVILSAQVAGQVQSTRTQNLYFAAGGRVTQVNVQNGDLVQAGQVLATLDVTGLQFQITNAELAVKRDQLQIQQLQAQLAASPPKNQDQAAQAALQMEQAQLTLEQDEANLAQAQQQLRQNEVIAPFAGVVNDVAISPGDVVQAYQVVMNISDPTTQAFIAKLDATTAKQLAVGDAFTLTMTGQKNKIYHGQIASLVIPTPDEIAAAMASGNPNGVPQPQATLNVTDYPGRPPLGATFSALIIIQERKNVLYLPSDAIRRFNGSTYVEVYDHGVISEKPVVTGLQGDTTTEIQSGVSLGEEVVEQ